MLRADYAETGGGMQSHATADRPTGRSGLEYKASLHRVRERMSLCLGFRCYVATLALVPLAAVGQPALRAPNVVEISSTLVTSGQPPAEVLARLGEQGFGAVISLSPPAAHDAVRDEPAIVTRQGLAFINIPIDFEPY